MRIVATPKNNKKTKSEQTASKDLRRELLGVAFLAAGLLFAFSLCSYSPEDPSLDTAATRAAQIHNLLGVAGSYTSGLLISLLGLSAFWFPIVFFTLAAGAFTGSRPKHPGLLSAGAVILVLSSAGLLALGPREIQVFSEKFSSGGILGLFIERGLVSYVNGIGASIILITSLVAAALICTNFSLIGAASFLWDKTTKTTSSAMDMVEKRRGRKAKTRAREEHTMKLGAQSEAVILEPAPPVKIKERTEPEFKQQQLSFMGSGDYTFPSLDLLDNPPPMELNVQRESLLMNSRLLEKKLLDFGVEGSVVEVAPGPVITMYEYQPAPGVKISKVAGLADDLALALRAHSIRIVAPIPGKAAIGVEIPNNQRETVYLKEIFSSEAFVESPSKLTLAMGKDITGVPVVADLTKMPHLLIAGATGAGKSVALNAMILSVLYKSSPDEVRFLMVDPKRIELSTYEGIPHLLHPVLSDPKQATLGLRWTVEEMERRYKLLAKIGGKNIKNYNAKLRKLAPEQKIDESGKELTDLPYIVVVIDELADLMMVSSKEVEASITRLAQMARAAGIHLILATQRPSVDVLTGVIKANFPVRVSFHVSSRVDSRTILDSIGAERLLGNGDMLFLPPGMSKLQRLHGPYVSELEVKTVTDFLKEQKKEESDDGPLLNLDVASESEPSDEEYDEKWNEALQVVTETGQASISMLQRRLRVGYNRAARMIELMEREGLVGPSDGIKPRQVYVNR